MMYLGDYAAGETVYFMWNSADSNGASITRSTNGTISVYKDANVTQTTTGVTDTEDYDGLTGVHHVAIATSDGFYTTATDFMVVLSAATIDTRTVNAVLAHFSIENRPLNAAKISANAIGAAAIADGAIDAATFAAGAITATVVATGAIDADALAADAAAEIADAVWDEDATGHQTGGTFGQAIGDPGADTNTIFKAVVTDATGVTVGVDVAAVLADTGTDGVVVASINTGAITADAIAANAIGASELAADAANEIADAILDRDMATGTDSGSTTVRTPRQALRALRNKVSIAGGTVTITKEDDATASWTGAVTTAAGDPISAIDPAGP